MNDTGTTDPSEPTETPAAEGATMTEDPGTAAGQGSRAQPPGSAERGAEPPSGAERASGAAPPPGAERRPRPVRPLTRPRRDRVLAGVASGVGAYLGVDPRILRVAFVVLTFFGGAGLLLYALGWLLIPDAGQPDSLGERGLRRLGDAPRWAQVAFVVLAALLFVDGIGVRDSTVALAFVLLALGIVLFRDDTRAVAEAGAPPDQRLEPGARPLAYGDGAFDRPAVAYEPVAPRPPRPRSNLGRITVAVALLAAGAAAAVADNVGLVDMTLVRHLALALTIVGGGLVAGGWWGRSRGLIFLGLLLVPPLLAVSVLPRVTVAEVGDRRFRPQTLAQVRDSYRLGVGALAVDLSQVEFDGRSVDVEAGVGVGELIVTVPDDVRVEVTGRLSGGRVDLFGLTEEGAPVRPEAVSEGQGDGLLQLEIDSGFGEVDVRRAGSEPSESRFDLEETAP